MNSEVTYIFLLLFTLMSLQALLALFQVRRYQKTVREMLKTGIIGVGSRRGGFFGKGEIIIISYDRSLDKVVSVKSMKGITVFAGFKEIPEYAGLSLSTIRTVGVELEAKGLKRGSRDNILLPSKKKGALAQAVEAIDKRIMKEDPS